MSPRSAPCIVRSKIAASWSAGLSARWLASPWSSPGERRAIAIATVDVAAPHPGQRTGAKPGIPWLEAAALAAILGAGLFLRTWQLSSQPPGIDLDEARNGVEVLNVLAGQHPWFFTTYDPREPLYIYSLSLSV